MGRHHGAHGDGPPLGAGGPAPGGGRGGGGRGGEGGGGGGGRGGGAGPGGRRTPRRHEPRRGAGACAWGTRPAVVRARGGGGTRPVPHGRGDGFAGWTPASLCGACMIKWEKAADWLLASGWAAPPPRGLVGFGEGSALFAIGAHTGGGGAVQGRQGGPVARAGGGVGRGKGAGGGRGRRCDGAIGRWGGRVDGRGPAPSAGTRSLAVTHPLGFP